MVNNAQLTIYIFISINCQSLAYLNETMKDVIKKANFFLREQIPPRNAYRKKLTSVRFAWDIIYLNTEQLA